MTFSLSGRTVPLQLWSDMYHHGYAVDTEGATPRALGVFLPIVTAIVSSLHGCILRQESGPFRKLG